MKAKLSHILFILLVMVCFITLTTDYSSAFSYIRTPQDIYGVAPGAKKFNLNAKPDFGGTLTYSSSDNSLAKIDEKGNVTVGKKEGTAIITISENKEGEIVNSKTVKIRITAYKTPSGLMAQSNWNYDHKTGDKKNVDSFVSKYKYLKNGYQEWNFIVRCTDPYISNHAATADAYIVKNPHFGYAQHLPTSQKSVNNRSSIYNAVHKVVGDSPTSKRLKQINSIKKYANASCTPTILAGYWLYVDMGSDISLPWIFPYNKKSYTYKCGSVNVEYHQLEKAIKQINKEYKNKGKLEPFEIIYVPANKRSAWFSTGSMKKHLYRGDIVCCCLNYKKGGHTSLVL